MRSCLPTRDGYCLHDRDPSVSSSLANAAGYVATKPARRFEDETQRLQLPGEGHAGHHASPRLHRQPMTAGLDVPKNEPTDVVAHPYSDARAGGQEALAHDVLHQVKAGLAGPIEQLYLHLASTRRGERS